MGFLNVLVSFLAYDDATETNNPRIRLSDISRQLVSMPTDNTFSRSFDVGPATSKSIASTLRPLSQDATTQYTVSLISGSTYRWLYAAGTNPILRTKRTFAFDVLSQYNVTKTGSVVRYTHNGTGTAPDFVANGVVVGDVVHIQAGGNFNILNTGTFTIVTVAASYIEVVNSAGVAEISIALGANINGASPMCIYSAAGVQIGDQVLITSTAFNSENRGVYAVTEVTAEFFELSNGNPGIPEGPIAVGSASGIVFYDDIYAWLYLESDQDISVRINNDTSDNIVVKPVVEGDVDQPGVFLFRGGIYKLDVANNGNTTAKVKVALAE